MRIQTALVTLLTSTVAANTPNFLSKAMGFNTLEYSPTSMNFSSSLSCAGCVRSGYDYCVFDRRCVEKATSDMLCSNQFADKYNFIYTVCQNVPQCETPSKYKITSNSNTIEIEIFGLKLGDSCTYKLQTQCGYPRIFVNITNS